MQEEYLTRDLGEAAALLTKGIAMASIQRKDAIVYFVFRASKKAEQASHDYFLGELRVPARTYYDNLRNLKRRLWSQEKR